MHHLAGVSALIDFHIDPANWDSTEQDLENPANN